MKKTYIMSYRAIYNKDKEKDLFEIVHNFTELSYFGKQIDEYVRENFGVNRVLVGNENGFLPIKKNDINKSTIYGNVYVFPNKYHKIFDHCGNVDLGRK